MARLMTASAPPTGLQTAQPRGRARLHDPVSPLACGQPARLRLRREYLARSNPWAGGALAALLPDGRLHLQHGPIDIVAEAWGAPEVVRAGYGRAAGRFATVLEELVAELGTLRAVLDPKTVPVTGQIARAMVAAVQPHAVLRVTPMAAVAGAVADAVMAALVGPGIGRAQVNNGGDIALWLAPGESLTCALAVAGATGVTGAHDRVTIHASDPVRGIATSGWRGRSFSLGIADAVTVLAPTAALADAAATVIANAVDLPGHRGIGRRPARMLQADSDLGARRVTVAVPPLDPAARAQALLAGLRMAEACRARGLIAGAALYLQGEQRTTGLPQLTSGGGGA